MNPGEVAEVDIVEVEATVAVAQAFELEDLGLE